MSILLNSAGFAMTVEPGDPSAGIDLLPVSHLGALTSKLLANFQAAMCLKGR